MSPTEKRKLERVRYWQGQKLRSRDFNDIHAVEEQRRWWHNRSLHNAYGIDEGFDADFNPDQSGVVVKAGLAYDCFGRELILETDQTVRLPPPSVEDQKIVLFARYRTATQSSRTDDLSAIGCIDARPAFVEFVWRQRTSCAMTDGVPVAEVDIVKGAKSRRVFARPSSRPLSRPLIASGSTVPGNTPWVLWSAEFSSDGEDSSAVFGVQTTIDTSAAGFTDAPCYFAWLRGPVFNPQTNELLPALFPSIADQTINGFTFRIALPINNGDDSQLPTELSVEPPHKVKAREFGLFAHKQNFYVNWVGCQKNASAPVVAAYKLLPLFHFDLSLFTTTVLRLNKL